MNFLRNEEVKRNIFISIIISLSFIFFSFILNFHSGFLMLFAALFFNFHNFYYTYKRYKKIITLSNEIDLILHNSDKIYFFDYSEGELSILQNEILKLTVRLREQKNILQNDKVFLSNSIADISHQLKTPLTSMNLIVNFFTEPEITFERRLELSQELSILLSKIEWLISTLLKMSRLDANSCVFKNEPVSLKSVIKKSIDTCAVSMDLREQNLHISCEDEIFNGDYLWTCEAITNIIKNCIEHTPNKGTIFIKCRENAIFTEIIISDNGNGINKKDLPHIFERFYRGADSDEKSVGIGLSLARMILIKQNATIKAENNFDKGAKFTVKFYKKSV